jgi:hypothetical protein
VWKDPVPKKKDTTTARVVENVLRSEKRSVGRDGEIGSWAAFVSSDD